MTEVTRLKTILSHIRVIGFDLDDTLWDNRPVIQKAVDEKFLFLDKVLPNHSLNEIEAVYTYEVERRVTDDPMRYQDMTLLRQEALASLCQHFDLSDSVAEQAWDVFYRLRQNFILYQDAKPLLKKLSERFILMVISNGNARLDHTSIAGYFDEHWQAGKNGRAKPSPEMLHKAMQHYDCRPEEYLYVGDNMNIDMRAVIDAGCYGLLIPSNLNETVAFEVGREEKERIVTLDDLQCFRKAVDN